MKSDHLLEFLKRDRRGFTLKENNNLVVLIIYEVVLSSLGAAIIGIGGLRAQQLRALAVKA